MAGAELGGRLLPFTVENAEFVSVKMNFNELVVSYSGVYENGCDLLGCVPVQEYIATI